METGPLIKGINYDVGTEYRAGEPSRRSWLLSDVERDMRTVRDELHCTAVNVYGSDLGRLSEAAHIALDHGLRVSIQPRAIDASQDATRAVVAEAASLAEGLGTGRNVTLNIGCELTMFTQGFIPGRSFRTRMRTIALVWPLMSRINARLDRYLQGLAETARERFTGRLTYGAGAWERVDWRPFDLIGVNLYRDRWNEKSYRDDLRALFGPGKPVVITEIGCATFEGAGRRGGGGWTIVDFDREPPRVKGGHRRSEAEQAREVGALLDLLHDEGVAGVYVFDFMAAGFPHRSAPEHDLDMASYGLVKVVSDDAPDVTLAWEPKASFAEVAQRYRSW